MTRPRSSNDSFRPSKGGKNDRKKETNGPGEKTESFWQRDRKKESDSKSEDNGKPWNQKTVSKSRDSFKVTFRLPGTVAPEAMNVNVVGEFNGWDLNANPMKKLKSGDFTTTLELAPGREYRFRYLIDQSRWENDWSADKYERGPYGSDDSVIIL